MPLAQSTGSCRQPVAPAIACSLEASAYDGKEGRDALAPRRLQVQAGDESQCLVGAGVTAPLGTTRCSNAAWPRKHPVSVESAVTIDSDVELVYTARNGMGLGIGFRIPAGAGVNGIFSPMS